MYIKLHISYCSDMFQCLYAIIRETSVIVNSSQYIKWSWHTTDCASLMYRQNLTKPLTPLCISPPMSIHSSKQVRIKGNFIRLFNLSPLHEDVGEWSHSSVRPLTWNDMKVVRLTTLLVYAEERDLRIHWIWEWISPRGRKSRPTKVCSAAADDNDDGPQSRSGLQGEKKNRRHYTVYIMS